MNQVIVITGATATGKTAVAMALSDLLPVHLISVDSAMVYRQMDIGTAKPTPDELARYPHALVDIRDPAESFTAADFVRDAGEEIRRAFAMQKTPVLVGGTMMYLQAFRNGLDEVPTTTPAVREKIAQRAADRGWAVLHAELVQIDPIAAAQIHPNNPQRLSRALEVYELTGAPISSFWGKAKSAAQRHSATLYETWIDVVQRSELHQRIEQRTAAMFTNGFIHEVAALRARGDLHPELPSMRAVGYRQVWEHLASSVEQVALEEQVNVATRGLARRQYTWLRRWENGAGDDQGGLRRFAGSTPAAMAESIANLAFS